MADAPDPERFTLLGPLFSAPGSRAFLGCERGHEGPLWPVAAVLLPEEIEDDLDRLRAFQEATARASLLDHPNVGRVIGCERLSDGWARIVEYHDGEPLRRVLQAVERAGRPGLSPRIGARIVLDACRGVHYVHERDEANGRRPRRAPIKPETLMVGFDGTTKVTGYGAEAVAPREADEPSALRRLQYAAPEDLGRPTPAPDRRSDVYALGLVLYEAVAGRPPWKADSPDFPDQVLRAPFPSDPITVAPALLRGVIIRALARAPSDRWPTAGRMAEALEAAGVAPPDQVAADLARLFRADAPERVARRQMLSRAGFGEGPLPRPKGKRAERPAPIATERPAPIEAQQTAPSPVEPEAPERESTTAVVDSPTPAPDFRALLAGESGDPGPAPTTARLVIAKAPRTVVAASAAVQPPSVPPPLPRPVKAVLTPSPAKRPVREPPPAPPKARAREALPRPRSPGAAFLAGVALATVAIFFYGRLRQALLPPPLRARTPAARDAATPGAPPPVPQLSAVALEPPPIRPATLLLDSDPPLAILLDGKARGTTPATLTVPPGEHHLRFRDKRERVDVERTVRVKPGERAAVRIELERASMEVTAPRGSKILLDGRAVGTAPVRTLHFWAGRHTIRVEMGGAVFERGFDAEPDETLTLAVHPEKVAN